jgi:hypothetical protein
MRKGEFYSLEDVFHKYGSREKVLELIAMGNIPDPWFEKDAVDGDINCRLRRRERLHEACHPPPHTEEEIETIYECIISIR